MNVARPHKPCTSDPNPKSKYWPGLFSNNHLPSQTGHTTVGPPPWSAVPGPGAHYPVPRNTPKDSHLLSRAPPLGCHFAALLLRPLSLLHLPLSFSSYLPSLSLSISAAFCLIPSPFRASFPLFLSLPTVTWRRTRPSGVPCLERP